MTHAPDAALDFATHAFLTFFVPSFSTSDFLQLLSLKNYMFSITHFGAGSLAVVVVRERRTAVKVTITKICFCIFEFYFDLLLY